MGLVGGLALRGACWSYRQIALTGGLWSNKTSGPMGRMWSNRTSALQIDCLTRQKPYKENRAYGPSVSNGTNGRLTSRRPLMWVVRVEDPTFRRLEWKIRFWKTGNRTSLI